MIKGRKLLLSLFLFLLFFTSSPGAKWVKDGAVVCDEPSDQSVPRIVPDGDGGAIIAWRDMRNGVMDIFAQRIDSQGELCWVEDAVEICTAPGTKHNIEMTTDGDGGAIIVWTDRRVEWDVFAQRVDANGSIMWKLDGIPVCMAIDEQIHLGVISDGTGGAIISWLDKRFGWIEKRSIFAQRIDATGKIKWDKDGAAVSTVPNTPWFPRIISDGAGGAIIVWQCMIDGNSDIAAQRVDAGGNVMWTKNGIAVCSTLEEQFGAFPAPDGYGGALISWWDRRNGNRDIYAQRVDSKGKIKWKRNGVAVCTNPGLQNFSYVVSDGEGGAIIAWNDKRNNNFDIYAQRIDAGGEMLWHTNGIPVCTAKGLQRQAASIPDDSGGVIITWYDCRNDEETYKIYAQRVDADGNMKWKAGGIALCETEGYQIYPGISTDGAGGAIATWEDHRLEGDANIFAVRIDREGKIQD